VSHILQIQEVIFEAENVDEGAKKVKENGGKLHTLPTIGTPPYNGLGSKMKHLKN
jgi:predicted enzyme related to lactoylglutathione lyase